MKAKVFNISEPSDKEGITIYVLGHKTKTSSIHISSVHVRNDNDEVLEIHIQKPGEKGVSIQDKIDATYGWIEKQDFVYDPSKIKIGIKINKLNRETKRHERVLIPLSDWSKDINLKN